MFVRKKTKLRIAYGLLVLASVSIITRDAKMRANASTTATDAPRAQFLRPAAPLPITPLAQSPFSAARPGHTFAQDAAVAGSDQSPAWFLTVAMTVDSGTQPLAMNRGTRVHLLGEQDGKLLVRRHGTDFLVEKTQITDDFASLAKLAKLARNSS